jgi:hypothetical protein
LKWRKLVLTLLEWLGMEEISFGLLEWLEIEEVNTGLTGIKEVGFSPYWNGLE